VLLLPYLLFFCFFLNILFIYFFEYYIQI